MGKALVLAGGFPQIELIKNLKARGYTVILADYLENPVAKKYADVFYRESTLDVEAISNIAKKEKVDFLITVCTDQALLTVAKVSKQLNLPCYIDYETAVNCTNKSYMKDVFYNNEIPTSKYYCGNNLEEIDIDKLKYPLIVKPVDCNSSKGVKKVYEKVELKKAFSEAVELSRTKTAIVEEFVSGRELTIDVYVENGKAKVLAVSESEKIASDNKFVIFRTIYPVQIPNEAVKKIEETAQKIATAFGIQNAPMLVQSIFDGENIFVLEFSVRTGGGVKFLHIKRITGFDVIDAVIELTLKNKPSYNERQKEDVYLINDFVYCKEGVFDHLEGFEELKKDGTILDYYLFKQKGAVLDKVESSGDRICGYTVIARTKEELKNKHNEARSKIAVISTSGQDILRHDLLTDLC